MFSKSLQTISFMAITIFLSKLFGLLRGVLLARLYGTGSDGDVFSAALRLPILLFDMTLGTAILSSFIPVFNKVWKQKNLKAAEYFANNFMVVACFFVSVICIIGMFFAPGLIAMVYSGYDREKLGITANILRILLPSIVFTTLAYSIVGVLQSFGEFIIPSIISLVSNGATIIYILIFGKKFGMMGMAYAVLASWSLQFIVQLPSIVKNNFHFKFIFDIKDKFIIDVVKLAWPIIISSWLQPICVIINMRFASFGEGLAAAMDYANTIYMTLIGVVVYAITNFILPKLSKLNSQGAGDAFAKTVVNSVILALYVVVPVMSVLVVLSKPVIELVYKGGKFDCDSVNITSIALSCYSFGIPGFAICEILNKSFYAAHKATWPMLASMTGIAANLVLSRVLFKYYGVSSLAFASAFGVTVAALLLLFRFNKEFCRPFTHKFAIYCTKIVSSGVCMALTCWMVHKILPQIAGSITLISNFIKLLTVCFIGMLVYFFTNYVFGVKEQRMLSDILLAKTK